MTQLEFPYLTIESLEANRSTLLIALGKFWPEAAPVVEIVQFLLPKLNTVAPVRAQLQHAIDWINAHTGAVQTS